MEILEPFPGQYFENTTLKTLLEIDEKLPEFLMYGIYPELFSYENELDKMDYLTNLINSYLYKDLLELSEIKNSGKNTICFGCWPTRLARRFRTTN